MNLDDHVLDGKQYQPGTAFQYQFFKQGITVSVNGARAQVHLVGDFFIRHFRTHEFQELYFPVI
jgi:hypothetical protein